VLPQGTKRKMNFVVHAMDPFFVPTIVGMKDACAMTGWDCQFNGPQQYSAEKTVEAFENALSQQPDAIAFTYTQPKIFDASIKKARDQNVFLIAYNTDSEGRKEQGIAYVGQDQIPAGRVSGYQAAKYAQETTKKTSGTIVIVTCCPGHSALEQRIQGTREGVEQYNQEHGTSFTTEVLAGATTDPEYLAKVQAKWTADQDKIVGFAGVDGFTREICVFVGQQGLKGKIAAGGFDYVDQTLVGIQNGDCQWSIGQDPYSQGFVPVFLAWIALERGYPARDYDTGAEVADASNIDRIVARENLWKEKAKEVGF